MSTNTIPGVLIEAIREGAYAVSRDVAEAIDHGEDLRVCRERLAGVCRLLEAVGWTRADPSTDTDVDLDVHAATLRPLAAIMLPLLRDAAGERDVYEALRALAAELPDVPLSLQVPVEVVVLLRSVLYAEVGVAAEYLAGDCSLRVPEDVEAKLARFDRVRGLQDMVGWSEPEQQQPSCSTSACTGRQSAMCCRAIWRSSGNSRTPTIQPSASRRATKRP
jgi:hypothetical protein